MWIIIKGPDLHVLSCCSQKNLGCDLSIWIIDILLFLKEEKNIFYKNTLSDTINNVLCASLDMDIVDFF